MKYCEIKKLSADTRTGKWWEGIDKKKGKKWTHLRHNGIYFPEPYTPLPGNIQIKYNGKPIRLNAENTKNPFNVTAEEAAVFFAQMIDRDKRLEHNNKRHRYSEDKKFKENFWHDWKIILGKNTPIKSLDNVDFSNVADYMREYGDEKKAAKKEMTKDEKLMEKERKDSIKDLYGYAIIDGNKIEMDYTVEPPGLYQGHGKHPLRGKIKKRLSPSDITLNVSKDSVPKCYIHGKECKWGEIVENRDVTWIAGWKHPITGGTTYKWLKRTESHFVCAGDMKKFDKARSLDKNIGKIRKKYTKDLSSTNSETRQLATAVYLLDELAIRPGTEKDEKKEAGTLGLTTLLCENVKFGGSNNITIDFTGKSSIQFTKKFKVISQVYKNLESTCKSKSRKDALFPKINASSLNAYLKTLLSGLTAKVFRTWKASSILQKELSENIPNETDPTHEKQLLYNKVNIEVAKALNHKKMTDSDDRVKKLKEKIEELEEKLASVSTEKQKATVRKAIDMTKSKLEEAENNIALGTSKVNYLDPRISVVWAKLGGIPIEKIYNKTQLRKFVWAMDVDTSWRF